MALTVKNLAIERSAPAPDTAARMNRAPGGTERSAGGELRPLTGLRIVAAVWVVAFHFHFTALPGVADVSALLGPLVTQGSLGVDLFFVLSGFVIAYTYLDVLGPRLRLREAGRFVWARAGRMWPAYFLVFNVFGVWMVARSVLGSDPSEVAFQAVQPTLSWGEWLQQVFLVQMWSRPFLDGAAWVGPTWSISAEWLAYLLFPVTALVFFRLRRLPVAVLALGAVALMAPMAASFVVMGSPYYPFSWLVRIVCGFSAGVLTLLVVRRLSSNERNRRAASALAGVTIGAIVAGLVASVVLGAGAVGAVTMLFPVLVGSLALADRGPARLLASRPMVHGGRISYALYLVHIPMFEVFWLALRRAGGDGFLAASSMTAHLVGLGVLLATIPVAHLLFTLVEQPARRWMRDLPGSGPRAVVIPSQGTAAGAVAVDAPDPADERVDNERARLDPATTLLPRLRAEPVDSERARLDPPTTRLPLQARPVPAQQLDTAVRVLARLHAASDAGHGDDREGDRLAGNLMAAARLRSIPVENLFDPAVRAEQVRAEQVRAEQVRAVQERSGTVSTDVGAQVPAPTVSEISDPGLAGAGLPVPAPPRAQDQEGREGALLTAEPEQETDPVPGPRVDGSGSRTGVERCGRARGRHSAHGSAATPIVATAAASVRGGNPMRRRRRPTHGLHYRDS
ncbi:acyltransferase [Pseudonocardia sp. KRD291]|uniref:acyltransferase n=1 Tax=Pseudonocardia sp. KRD291 TaxID=2792007 RepID=UPI001C4A445E|nr:acyltransferase [Pseudonocardia sp. KRD291]MBW0104680.1 acyltransferase family protein [Pseudonocardia sp. KRD291]